MRINIVGTGNCAVALGELFIINGHIINRVIARNADQGRTVASQFGAVFTPISEKGQGDADFFVICISDTALPEAVSHLSFGNSIVVHTAGALSSEILKPFAKNYGVLYPLQTFRKELQVRPAEIPFLISGSDATTLLAIRKLAESLSSSVTDADKDQRLRLHAAAVIVNNFTNHLYTVAKDFCDREGVDFNLLKPLIRETAQRVQDNDPGCVQTGPAVRKDILTLDKHLRLLARYPKLRTIYMRMTDNIMNP